MRKSAISSTALREVEVASGRRVAYIGGIDLCHVGPEFGDPTAVAPEFQEQVRQFDDSMLARAASCDPEGWFRTAASIGNRWRVCGLAATYTMLRAIGPAEGRLLKYHQAIDDRRTCCVSFASMAFHSARANRDDTHLMTKLIADPGSSDRSLPIAAERPPCAAPADYRHELEMYDRRAVIGRCDGPRYRMTYRTLGTGPPLVIVPGIASTYRIYAILLNRLSERFRTSLVRVSRRSGR